VKPAIGGVIAGALLLALVVTVGLATSGDAGSKGQPANNVLANAVDVELGRTKANLKSPSSRVSGAAVNATLERMGVLRQRLARSKARYRYSNGSGGVHKISKPKSEGCPSEFHGRGMTNTRVNQDCSLRRQAEEWVGVNPRDFDNVLAGQNDSMIGFNHCGYDWSFDRGKNWGSAGTSPPPFWQMLFTTNDSADACSDPAGTFDHVGNAYVTGVFFEVADVESAIWVAKSNWPNGGAFYHTPQPGPFQEYTTTGMGTPASDNNAQIFHDKELMVADSRSTSSKKGRVYVTWTRFEDPPGTASDRSPIVFSQSIDGGATWSAPTEISGNNPAICTVANVTPGDCDQDQGSHPVVGPDGTIYVIFGNGNTPLPGINQVLIVKCPATNTCTSEADWSTPVKIGDLVGTHPIGDPGNAGGCPVGRQCLPPNGYRVPEFTSMSISVDRQARLYATWSDFRNGDDPGSTCGPFGAWSTRTPPCDNDVFYSFSTDGGATWSPTVNLTPRSRLGANAQWQPWSDVAGDGSRVYAAFYDRQYGDCEFTGCNDITLATISNPRSANPQVSYKRITTASMPNLVPANNPVQAGFLGDYMWVEVSHHNFDQKDVHIVWADTRPLAGRLAHQRFPEEDIYYAQVKGH
jgi:hypothetical protein